MEAEGEYNLYYYATPRINARELYSLAADPFQLYSIYPPPSTTFRTPRPSASPGLLLSLKPCKGQSRIEPWQSFHPGGDVRDVRGCDAGAV